MTFRLLPTAGSGVLGAGEMLDHLANNAGHATVDMAFIDKSSKADSDLQDSKLEMTWKIETRDIMLKMRNGPVKLGQGIMPHPIHVVTSVPVLHPIGSLQLPFASTLRHSKTQVRQVTQQESELRLFHHSKRQCWKKDSTCAHCLFLTPNSEGV